MQVCYIRRRQKQGIDIVAIAHVGIVNNEVLCFAQGGEISVVFFVLILNYVLQAEMVARRGE